MSVQSAVWGRIFQNLQATMPFEEQSASESEAISLMKKRLSKFETEQGRLKGLSYVPKSPDEVVITTTPKAGTTWLQQWVVNFGDISS